jgi:outer membrane immunogenic protein
MKKMLLALAAVAAFTGSASAADLPRPYVKAPPPPPVAVANWTGCYVGAGGGYALFDQENTGFDDGVGAPLTRGGGVRTRITETVDTGGRGWFGTVQAGCDYQFGLGAHQFIVGAFGDYDFADVKGNHNPPGTGFWAQEKMTDQWAVGGRVGWIVLPQLMTFFSAGYTEARFNRQDYTNLVGPPFGIPQGFFTDSRWYKGWFLGAGDEYAISFLPGLFWKTEYRFSRFDTEYNPVRVTATGGLSGYSEDSKKYIQSVRSELVYRFNWGGPVVAKY